MRFTVTTDLDRIAILLDRLDPPGCGCEIEGCVHIVGASTAPLVVTGSAR